MGQSEVLVSVLIEISVKLLSVFVTAGTFKYLLFF